MRTRSKMTYRMFYRSYNLEYPLEKLSPVKDGWIYNGLNFN